MKKIGIFTGYYLPHLGGVERYTEKLTEQLQKLGYEVIIITSNHSNLPNIDKEKKSKIYRLPIRNIFKQRYPIPHKNREWKELISKIEEENFDYYLCNTRFHLTTLIGAKIAKKKNKPLLILEHGSNHFTVNNRILDYFGAIYEHKLTNCLKKYNPRFYGVSERCNEWLKHFSIKASGVLYNAIDDNANEKYKQTQYIEKKEKQIIITYSGRLIAEKGILLLLSAFQKLSAKYSNISLYIAGDGALLNELKEKYSSKNIHFEGKLGYDRVMSLYNSTDIFVYPSMFPEGLPTSILEAGIMECAVIATDRGGTIEVINDEKYGLIMEENEENLTKKLEELLNNQEKIKQKGIALQKRVKEKFTWQNTANKLDKILEEYK